MNLILGLLKSVIDGVMYFVRRRDAKNDDPLEQHRRRTDAINEDLAKGDLSADRGGADLDELDRLRNKAGPGDTR